MKNDNPVSAQASAAEARGSGEEGSPTGYEWGIESAIEQAEAGGFTVVRSTDRTLLLDLDDGAALETYREMLPKLAQLYGLKEAERWHSKSGVGVHVVVACEVMSFQERVALQACLGSDRMREALAIAMAADGEENPSVLFKPRAALQSRVLPGDDAQGSQGYPALGLGGDEGEK